MGLFIYRVVISCFRLGLWISFPFSRKTRKFLRSRRGNFQKIEEFSKVRNPRQPAFWFHCASLGEFEQGRPVMEALKSRNPRIQIILTFFSPSGYKVRKNYEGADLVCYLPLDGKRNATRFVRYVRPRAAFFIRYEFWYAYFSVLQENRVPILSVSTLFTADKFPFQWYGSFYKSILRKVTYYFAQDATTAELLRNIGIRRVSITGDTRFDRVAAICQHAPHHELVAAFKQNNPLMVVGSSWPQDLEVLLPFVKETLDQLKFVIAPHNIEEEEIQRIEKSIPYKTLRYSKVKKETISNYRVLIIDNVGMLTSLYRYGNFAYVGGAFGKSLHNILEPATFGMPIFFGNKSYRHVNEANALLKQGVAFTVNDAAELREKFMRIWNDVPLQQRIAEDGRKYVQENTGATADVVEYVHQHILINGR